MSRRYFGTDGIRGRVGDPPITADFVLRLGHAAGRVLAKRVPPVAAPGGKPGTWAAKSRAAGPRPAVLIGKDTRISGYMLEAALQAGFASAGVDVLLTGPLPTPGVAYLTRALRLSAGVVISASHNRFDDNGIKFFSADGDKLPDEDELAIEAAIDEPMECVGSELLGRAQRIDDAAGRYVEFCKRTFPAALDLRGMKLVIDCANGAGYHTAPLVFHELGAEVVTIGAEPNGLNINEGCGATAPQALRTAVLEHGADLGIAIDGDADRLIVVDRDGRIYDGDELLYVIVLDRMQTGEVEGAVGTLMTNLALEQAFERLGVGFERAKVGDRYVLERLRAKGWSYGGENSGHLLCLDCHRTGDGTISALQVLAAMRRQDRTLAQLCESLVLYPQKLINVKVERGFDWQSHEGLLAARRQVEAELGDGGRILVRPSGTEPVLRLMVEARSEQTASEMAGRLAASVSSAA